MVLRGSLNGDGPAEAGLRPVPARDPLDVSLNDPVLRAEVELLIRLMETANVSEGPLDRAAIDRALFGVD